MKIGHFWIFFAIEKVFTFHPVVTVFSAAGTYVGPLYVDWLPLTVFAFCKCSKFSDNLDLHSKYCTITIKKFLSESSFFGLTERLLFLAINITINAAEEQSSLLVLVNVTDTVHKILDLNFLQICMVECWLVLFKTR